MNRLKIGLIGCGGFAIGMHVPNIKRNPRYIIHAAMDINEEAAKAAAVNTDAKYWTSDLERVLNDKDIDIVFITTRHDTHADLTIKAANAGKHILCEKPMGLNIAECRMIAETVVKSGVKYTVGYNRGMAPMITRARDLLKGNPHKKIVYHRIQAPFPEDSWTHDLKVGGGRFVGEGCHIFDLLCEIIGAPPISVYASGGTFLNPEKVKIPDSAIITITFDDGSVGTTLINSAGCSSFPKEATEIYCNDKAIYINDFKKWRFTASKAMKRLSLNLILLTRGMQ